MTNPTLGDLVEFTFKTYGPEEKEKIGETIRSLSVRANGKIEPLPEPCPGLEDAWLIGTFDEVFQKVDEVTLETIAIGQSFLEAREDDPSRMQSFFWRVERPDPCLTSLLDIGLWLVPVPPRSGHVILSQVVLRIGGDEFVYWGVD